MNNFDYKNMTPFKWFVLENFPFIENDFDAINNYHLFSKVVEYLNKTIDNMNLTGEQMENVTNAMTNLQNYVNNYFDNLDVEDEINNKLDEMVEDGTFENIIRPYLDNVFTPALNDMQHQINSFASGSPLIANSVSEMTDTTKIYVNTSDGNWYYYNGTNWVIGGPYQAKRLNDNSIFPNKLTFLENDKLLSTQTDITNVSLSPNVTSVLFDTQELGEINIQQYDKIYINISSVWENLSQLSNIQAYLRINVMDSENNILNRTNINFDYTKLNSQLNYFCNIANATKAKFFLGINYSTNTSTTVTVHVENFVVSKNKKWFLDPDIISTKSDIDLRGCENLPFYIDVKNRMNFMLGSINFGSVLENNNGRLVSLGYQALSDTTVEVDFTRFRLAIIRYSDGNFTPSTALDSGWKNTKQTITAGTYFRLQMSSALSNANEYDLVDNYDNDLYKSLKMIDEYCYLTPENLTDNNISKIPNILVPRKTRYIGHRGALYQAPENTVASFTKAGQNDRLWGIETDIYFSSDHKMFCIHDTDLSIHTDGTGNINSLTASEIRQFTIDYGAHLEEYPNEKVPYFSEFLDVCFKYGKTPIIELKDINNVNYTYLIVDEIKKYGFEESCIVISFSETLINKIRELTPKIHCQLLIAGDTDISQNITTYVNKINTIKNCGISIDYQDTYTKENVETIHSNYGSFGIWTLEGFNEQYNENLLDTVTINL